MSFIQDALKRAQKQREEKDPLYVRMGASGQGQNTRGRKLILIAVLVAGGISLALGAISHFKKSAPAPGPAREAVQTAPQPPMPDDAAPEPGEASPLDIPPETLNQPPEAPEDPMDQPAPEAPMDGLGQIQTLPRGGQGMGVGLPRPAAQPQAQPAPGNPAADEFYAQGLDLQNAGKAKDAEKYYLLCLEKASAHAKCLNNLAVICMERGDYKTARTRLLAASQADTSYADPLYNLACVAAREKNENQAMAYLKVAILRNREARKWAVEDKDFSAYRNLPAFMEMTSGAGR